MAVQETNSESGVGADNANAAEREEVVALSQELAAVAEQVPLDLSRLQQIGNRILDLVGRVHYRKPLVGAAARAVAEKVERDKSAAEGAATDGPTDKKTDDAPVVRMSQVAVVETMGAVASLRTAEEIAEWLTSLRPGQTVTAAQVQAVANDDPAIHPNGNRFSAYAAGRIRRALGISED